MDVLKPEYKDFVKEISRTIPRKRIYTDALRRLCWGTDASFYRLLPQVVVRVADESEMQLALKAAARRNLPVTFRAAGTSLSGQSITDSILLVAGKEWESYRLLDPEALGIACQPGIIGSRVSAILEPYNRVFSPDPASKNSAMVGGIVANNASGMKCGVHANSDRVLRSVRIILADGTVLDTADEESRKAFAESHKQLLTEIKQIREEIIADNELTDLIHRKYSIKNVTGLNLLPFVLFEDPFEIITHCMVGSEGTLAFMSEIRFNTEKKMPFTSSAMIYFADMAEACRCVVELRQTGTVQACELLDKKSLASVHDTTGEGLTALLLQVDAESAEDLNRRTEAAIAVVNKYNLFKPAHFSTDAAEVAAWWQMRSGVFPAVGGTRPLGTTALIEDIAFHIEDLPAATVELAALLETSGYDDACIYGHAFEGNYHFVIAQSFETQAEVDKYRDLMKRLEELVVGRYNGSLKAEHGTGRNMAPFVEAEWGTKAWEMMKRLKKAFDPQDLLNKGVIFNDDPECYIRNMKPLPLCNDHVDRCIECGFCEVNCVSCGLTLSARQRIVASREIARLERTGEDPELLKELRKGFKYYGNETCAGDGLCSTSCPMKINTADLTHDIREQEMGETGKKIGNWCGKHLGGLSSGIRVVLSCANVAHKVLGDKGVKVVGNTLHKAGVPLWSPALPNAFYPGHLKRIDKGSSQRKLVYFPSCLNRLMGPGKESSGTPMPLADLFVELCKRAGYEVIFPADMDNLCCGMIWESKGMPEEADRKTRELEAALIAASDGGKIPVVCDQSPCLHRMRNHIKSLTLHEPAEFILDYLLPHLKLHRVERTVAVHVTCSSRLMGLADKIVRLASLCATKVVVPAEVGCCGFAGDKGFTYPELNAWGLRKLRPALEAAGATEGYSNSRTCEIGLTDNGGIPYKSIAYLVYEASTPQE